MKNSKPRDELTMPDWSVGLMGKIDGFFDELMPKTLSKRLLSAALICAGVETWKIEELTGYSARSIATIRQSIREGREDEIFTIKGGGRPSKLTKEGIEDQVIDILEKENIHTQQQLVSIVENRFGVKISKPAAGRLFKKHGYKKYKCGSLPAKADAEAQRVFVDTIHTPLLERAKKDDNVIVLSMDAAHFVIGCDFLGSVYSKSRRFIRTFSGRQRHNVLGAIDLVSKRVLTVENDKYINGESVCDMLKLVHETYKGKEVHIILDNARYQKCSDVLKLAAKFHITLDYLPSYSPNLNLIERLWKFVKSELRQTYYDDFSVFKAKIAEIIASTATSNYSRICKLIGEKIQLFDGLRPIDCHTLVVVRKAS